MKKKIFAFLLCCFVLLLCACGQEDKRDDDRDDREDKETVRVDVEADENFEADIFDIFKKGTEVGETQGEVATQGQPENIVKKVEAKLVVSISFETRFSEKYDESAIISGMTEDGEVVWQYETGEYQVAQLASVEEIGWYNDMYYFCELGTIIALKPQTGEVIWKNIDFGGAGICYDFDEQENLYIAGYFGPDLMIVDKNGQTLKRCTMLDNEKHLWPYKMEYAGEYVFITYEHYDDWIWEERAFWEDGSFAQYGGYTMSYSLKDGSLDTEHNVIEQSPQYHCFFEEDNNAMLQIDYLGEGVYLVNVTVEGTVCASNLLGYSETDAIRFSGSNDNYFYDGTIYKYEEGLAVVFQQTNNAQLSLNKEYLFGVAETFTDDVVLEEELTSEELMARISEVSATSALSEYGGTHDPGYIIDDKLETGWVEGVTGQGINESITLTLCQESTVKGFFINAGYHKSDSLYEKNSRPQQIRVIFSDGTEETFSLNDIKEQQQCTFSVPRKTSSISIMIEAVYPGSKYEDTVISEIVLY